MSMGMSYGITAETGNNIQTDGLVFYVDAAYKKSYTGREHHSLILLVELQVQWMVLLLQMMLYLLMVQMIL